jgi:hypothetical protein
VPGARGVVKSLEVPDFDDLMLVAPIRGDLRPQRGYGVNAHNA